MKKNILSTLAFIGLMTVAAMLGAATGEEMKANEMPSSGFIERINGCQYAVKYYGSCATMIHAGNCDNKREH